VRCGAVACLFALPVSACGPGKLGLDDGLVSGSEGGSETAAPGTSTGDPGSTTRPTSTLPPTSDTTGGPSTTFGSTTFDPSTGDPVTTGDPSCTFFEISGNPLPLRLGPFEVLGQPDLYSAPCVESFTTQPEVLLVWRAPARGLYRATTVGSDYDTVLHVLDGVCEGPSLACNDDANESLTSEVVLALEAGQTITFVADSYSDIVALLYFELEEVESGPLPNCQPDVFLGTADSVQFMGSTFGRADRVDSLCGGAGPEEIYRWQAPFSGRVAVTTSQASIDTVIDVFGDACFTDPPVLCVDDSSGSTNAEVVVNVRGGEIYDFVVSGKADLSGDYVFELLYIG